MGEGWGSSQDLTNPKVEVELLSTCLSMPLSMSTKKKEVIVLVVSNGGGGLSNMI
jgi:hypothetical protein